MATLFHVSTGAWYLPHADDTTHFKSADGHRGVWRLALRRLNLRFAELLIAHGNTSCYNGETRPRPLELHIDTLVTPWALQLRQLT